MKVVISGIPGANPVVLDNLTAILFAGSDDAPDGTAPTIASGKPKEIASLAALSLVAVREKLGAAAFEEVIRAARGEMPYAVDAMDSVRVRS